MTLPAGNWLKAVGGGVLLLAVVFAANSYLTARDAEWEARVERVQERARADSAAAERHRATADSLEIAVDSLREQVGRRDTVIRLIEAEIDSLPPEPEGCRVFTEPRDRLISECQLQVADVKTALQKQREAAAELRAAEARATQRGDSLSAVLDDRPRPRPSWVPSVALGPFAGFCTDGRACAGIGVQLSWRVNLF